MDDELLPIEDMDYVEVEDRDYVDVEASPYSTRAATEVPRYGSGGGDMVGGIISAVTDAVAVTAGIAFQAVETTNDAYYFFNNVVNAFNGELRQIRKLEEEAADADKAAADAKRSVLRKARWSTPPAGCRPNDPEWGTVYQGAMPSDGIFADCAYKDPWGANALKTRINDRRKHAKKVRESRHTYTTAKNLAEHAHEDGHGNLAQYRVAIREVLLLWMYKDLYSTPLIIQFGNQGKNLTPTPFTGEPLDPDVLKLIFPNRNAFPDVWDRGVLPFSYRDSIITGLANNMAQGFIPPSYSVPFWLLGYRPSDSISSLMLPNVGDLFRLRTLWNSRAQLPPELLGPAAQFSGTEPSYGAVSAADFDTWVHYVLESGRAGQAAQAADTLAAGGTLPAPEPTPPPQETATTLGRAAPAEVRVRVNKKAKSKLPWPKWLPPPKQTGIAAGAFTALTAVGIALSRRK